MGDTLNEKYYRFIFENSLDAILLTIPDGRIYKANQAACEMFMMTESEICFAGHDLIVDPNDPNLQKAIDERKKTGKVRAELTFLRKGGSKFIGDVTSAIFKDEKGTEWSAMIIRDVTKYKLDEEKLIHSRDEMTEYAMYDILTGTLNRRGFVNKLQQEMSRAKRENKPLSLIFMDLDCFKKVNDVYGHAVGDEVLKRIVNNIALSLRSYDIVGRYGGDEILICLPNTSVYSAVDIAERLRYEIEQITIHWNSYEIRTTVSSGVLSYDSTSNDDTNSLIEKVDNVMYSAKTKRNCVFIIDDVS